MTRLDEVLDAAVASVGGEPREGQRTMARAVADALRKKHHLLVQAGTGTGKSLAYLVPAMLHDEPIVISTATLNLQHQLIQRDIPALLEAARASLGTEVTSAVVKGRRNYACLHRVHDGVPDDQEMLVDVPTGELGTQVLELRSWAVEQAQSGGSGERDHAPSHREEAWSQVSVSARECLGAVRCPFAEDCFAELAKQAAAQADIIVTNHALLAIDTIEGIATLPPHGALIIDEAHELAARVTNAASVTLTPAMIHGAARVIGGTVEDHGLVDDLNDASDALADVMGHLRPERIKQIDGSLGPALRFIADAARAVLSDLNGQKPDREDEQASLARAKLLVDEVHRIAERMLALDDDRVLWASGEPVSGLVMAPLDIAGALRGRIFDTRPTILTSATMALGGTFEPVAASLGLIGAEWEGLDVGSPFDYGRQGILYVPAHLPPPGRDGIGDDQLAEITALVKAAGGRTLGLFSSRRAAEKTADHVRRSLSDITVLCQGDAHLSELVGQFAAEETTCLFGSLGLWQGVDVKGPSCSLVIIDRIPFPRPDDPLMSARSDQVAARGGNGFMAVSVHHAALLLAQGAGRLVRGRDDQGVVAILDPRMTNRGYGNFLSNSLPPMWRTRDRKLVMGSLQRLDEARLEKTTVS